MEVAARTDRLRQYYSTGIYGLKDAEDVASSGDLFDEDRGEALLSELFVDAQKIDFGAVKDL